MIQSKPRVGEFKSTNDEFYDPYYTPGVQSSRGGIIDRKDYKDTMPAGQAIWLLLFLLSIAGVIVFTIAAGLSTSMGWIVDGSKASTIENIVAASLLGTLVISLFALCMCRLLEHRS